MWKGEGWLIGSTRDKVSVRGCLRLSKWEGIAIFHNSTVPFTNLCKFGEIMSNFDTKHDLKVDCSNINAQDKKNCIKVSTYIIWKSVMFKISMLFNET